MKSRTKHEAGFKAKVALAALREDRAADHGARFFIARVASLGLTTRRQMVAISGRQRPSVRRQCQLLSLHRSGLAYKPTPTPLEDLESTAVGV